MSKVCKGPKCLNPAVMDLVFGEMAEQARVPWCARCICPDTWDTYPFHHAESYSQDWEAPAWPADIEKTSREALSKAFKLNDDYILTGTLQANKLGGHAPNMQGVKAEDKSYTIGDAVKEVVDFLKENFIPKMPSSVGSLGTEHLVPTKEQLECEAAKQAELKKEIAAPLYNRQPHYEGGIDPITFGKDNLSSSEMNGFYKMNVIKYVARCDRKNGLEDLQKARDYLNLLIAAYEKNVEPVEEKAEARKKRVAAYKAVWHTEEEERALKEAELCVDRFHADLSVEIKRQEVLDIVQDKLKGEDYTMLCYGDGTTFIEKNKLTLNDAERAVDLIKSGKDAEIQGDDMLNEVFRLIGDDTDLLICRHGDGLSYVREEKA